MESTANFVRPVSAADIDVAAAVQHAAWHSAYAPLAPASVVMAATLEHMQAVWANFDPLDPAGMALLAGRSGTVEAVAVTALAGDTAELLALYVHPKARRIGHASRLLAQTVSGARSRGAITLGVWAPAKDTARLEFLRATGMKPTGGKRELFGEAHEPPMVELHYAASLADDGEADDRPALPGSALPGS